MRHYGLYFKKCPGVENPTDWKVGIFALDKARTRLASYQNAVGPVYEESFFSVWLGDENQIRMAEREFKKHFKDKIQSAEAGLSEWICGVTLIELNGFIKELREEYFIKMVDAPAQFLPLTMPLCEDLEEWYLETGIKNLQENQ